MSTESAALQALEHDVIRWSPGADQPGGHAVIIATGADRIRFLHGLLTGKVEGTPAGSGARSALLTPKGQVVSDLHLFIRADDVLAVVPGGEAERTAAALSRYAIMDDFTATARPDWALLGILGPRASAPLAALGLPAAALDPLPPYSHLDTQRDGAPLWLGRVRQLGVPGYWLAGPAAALTAIDQQLAEAGVLALPPAAAEAARVAALEPCWGAEITGDYFPMEVGLGDAIDYTKGCYLGQEPIVRIRDRGHVNWRLVGLDVQGAADPSAGDRLETDAKPKAGRVTSAARLPDGRGVALGLLHVSIPVGTTVRMLAGDQVLTAFVRAEVPPERRSP